MDTEGKIIECTSSALKLFNIIKEFIGKNFLEFFQGENKNRGYASVELLIKGDRPLSANFILNNREGKF